MQREASFLRGLVIAAVAWQGLGMGLFRALVEAPAWQHLGAAAWADFSRQADLGPGLVIYPVYGIVSWVIVLAAAVLHSLDRKANRAASVPIYLAALFSIVAAFTTVIAAPTMLSITGIPNGASSIEAAFARFTLWGVYIRGGAFALSFLASLAALVALLQHGSVRGRMVPRNDRKATAE